MANMFKNKEEFNYLTIKTNIFIEKLKQKYTDVVTMCIENDPGNLRIGFQSWGPDHMLVLILGAKNERSFWINQFSQKTSVPNNGLIEPSSINQEFDDLCIIIDKLITN